MLDKYLFKKQLRNTYCSLLRDLRAQAQSARHVKREEREKELFISVGVPYRETHQSAPNNACFAGYIIYCFVAFL